jgi:phospholipase/carboxylesterase
MPEINYWRTDRPAGGGPTIQPPADPVLPVRTFLPDQYEPRYPYPLVVLFHDRGGNEDQVLRLAPRVSAQNFIYISLRGPEQLGKRADGRPACGWAHPDAATMFPEYVRLAVEMTRQTYHIHSERIYLAGVNEGCDAAFRAAFGLGDRIAGLIALNGAMPRPTPGVPLFRFDALRNLRVFLGHGVANLGCPRATAERDYRLLYAAGADVHTRTYPTSHKVHADMLRDVNRWIIGNVNAEYESYQLK